MPWTQGTYAPPNNFVQQYDLGQKKIRADLVDENFNDAAGAINTLNDSLTDVSAAATTTALGRARVATDAEVRAMATSGTSPAFLTPEQVSLMPMFNTRLVLTTSQSWSAPVDGWYRVTCVGGGGAGGTYARASGGAGCGGLGGGTTSFGSYLSAEGGGGGGGGRTLAGSGGGGAGLVTVGYFYLASNTPVSITIGAGGLIQTTAGAAPTGYGHGENALTSYNGNFNAGSGAKGAGSGVVGAVAYQGSPTYFANGNGGNGGSNGTGYGGGGGGAGAGPSGLPGLGGDNAQNGTTGGTFADCNGGNGGSGAVILEYFDPSATA